MSSHDVELRLGMYNLTQNTGQTMLGVNEVFIHPSKKRKQQNILYIYDKVNHIHIRSWLVI